MSVLPFKFPLSPCPERLRRVELAPSLARSAVAVWPPSPSTHPEGAATSGNPVREIKKKKEERRNI